MGFIKVQQLNDRWVLLDPDGKPFLSKGICYVNHKGEVERSTKTNPYRQAVERTFDCPEDWAAYTRSQLESFGFNTLGPWSSEDLFRGQMYSICVMNLARDDWEKGTVDDYFSPGFLEHAERVARETIETKQYRNNTQLIGYCTGGEMRWGSDWRSPRSIVFDYLNMSARAEGKIAVIEQFKQLYKGDLKRFGADWQQPLRSWDEALQHTQYAKRRKTARAAEEEVLYMIAKQYFRTAHAIIRKYDPNHLILGTRLLSVSTPRSVVRACKDYVDVLSVNHYKLMFGMDTFLPYMTGTTKTDGMLEEFHRITGKPILITEFGYRVAIGDKKRYQPAGFPTFGYDAKRGKQAFAFIRKAVRTKFIVGWHLFQWFDQPPGGRFDGQDSNFGLVNVHNEVHQDYARYVTEANGIDWDE